MSTQINHEKLFPAVMTGISMAPWLMPGDGLLIDEDFPLEELSIGDVLAIRHNPSASTAVHRLIGFRDQGKGLAQLIIKGDRNRNCDSIDDSWQYIGRVCRKHRKGNWRDLKWGYFLAFLSRWGLYPGQKIPLNWTRTRLLNVFRIYRSVL